MPKPRINLRLSGDVYAKLDEMTRRPGATKSAIIEQALREYFNPEIRQGMEERILKARSNGMSKSHWKPLASLSSTGSHGPIRCQKANAKPRMRSG